jgi:hypothetical protein
MSQTNELLTSLSFDELEALAECQLAPAAQTRLSELLERGREKALADDECAELDRLLRQADQLTLLKTRARYTLNQAQAGVSGA